MVDMAARLNKEKLDDPNVLREDDPPLLRFAKGTLEDRVATIETGNYSYKDADYVYISAYGDNKNVVPYVARTTMKVPTTETIMVRTQVPIKVRIQNADGTLSEREEYEERDMPEERVTYVEEEVFPWFDQLRERLHNGRISADYLRHCELAYQRWVDKGESPIEGIPIVEWAGITEAHRKRLLDMGINSVERVAEMTEDAIQEFGMGARDVKTRAQKYLESNSAANARVEQMEKEHATQMSALAEKMAQLEAQLAEQPKRGRPKKEVKNEPADDSTESVPKD